MSLKILLAGESWVSSATHYKGFDQFGSVTFHLGAEPMVAALEQVGHAVRYMPAHECATAFPFDVEALREYDVVILSDIGANTLLLHPDVWLHGKTVPNRLKVVEDYVCTGGGLAMVGGYFSFQGINGAARFRRTPVEAVLPVECLAWDDRIEVPEGFVAEPAGAGHAILDGLTAEPWPALLGINEVVAKPDAEVCSPPPRLRAPIPSSWSARPTGAGPSPGHPISVPIGPPTTSWRGPATLACGIRP